MARPRAVKPAKGSSQSRTSKKSVSSVTKKVRMTEAEADRLADVASAAGKTESEVLREGIVLAHIENRRQRAIEDLVRMAEESAAEPARIAWRGR